MGNESEFLDAARRGASVELMALIRATPGLVRAADEHGKTALHWAAEKDHADVASVLVIAGADIEAKTTWGATPLDWAAAMGGRRVGEMLLARGATGLTLIVAAGLGKLSAVETMAVTGADLAAHRRRDAPVIPDDHWPADTAHIAGDALSDALYAAARNGHTDVVTYLLGRGARVDAKGVFGATGMHWAAINGHAPMVELLLARGASVTMRDARFDGTPEDWAREGGHRAIVETLRRARLERR